MKNVVVKGHMSIQVHAYSECQQGNAYLNILNTIELKDIFDWILEEPQI